MMSCALQLSKQRHVRFAPYSTAGDQAGALALVTFYGIVDTHDPASAQEVRVSVVSVRAPKMQFLGVRLENVDKVVCLRSLGAHVSNRPDELQVVKADRGI